MDSIKPRKKTFWERKRERIEKRFNDNRLKDADLREALQEVYRDVDYLIAEMDRVQDDSLVVYFANNRALTRIRIEDRDRSVLESKK